MPSETIIVIMRTEGDEQFAQAMGRSEDAARGAGTATEEAGKSAQKGARGLAIAAGAAVAMYKGYSLLKGAVNTTVQLAKNTAAFSRVSGLDAKQSQNWVLVAQERGIQTKQLGVSMATLGRAIGSVGGPTKATAATLQELGVNQESLIKMPMQQRMETLAQAFTNLPNGVNKAALAQKLFGRSGQQLLPILTSGAKGLHDTLTEAGKLVPYQKNAAQNALNLAQQQRTLNMAMTGMKVAVGTALLPILTGLAQSFTPIVAAVATLLRKVPILSDVIIALGTAIGGMLIISKITPLLEAFGVSNEFVMSSLGWAGLIIAIVAALVLAYQKVGWFRDFVNGAFAAIKAAVSAVFNWVKSNWPLLVVIFTGPIGTLLMLVIKNFAAIKAVVVGAFNAVVNAATTAFNAVKNAIMAVFDWIKANWKLLAIILLAPFSVPLATAGVAIYLLRDKVKIVLNAIKAGFESLVGFISGVVNSIVSFMTSIPKRVVGAFTSLKSDIGRVASGMFDGVKSAMSSVVSFITSKVTAILNLITKVINEIKSLPGKVASPITSVAGKVGGFASGLVSHIPGLAGGGTATHGGAAVVGERGPEIVALPGGATVTPLPILPTGGVAHRPIITKVYLDRKVIATAIGSYAADLQAAR